MSFVYVPSNVFNSFFAITPYLKTRLKFDVVGGAAPQADKTSKEQIVMVNIISLVISELMVVLVRSSCQYFGVGGINH